MGAYTVSASVSGPIPKDVRYENKDIRDSAHGEQCHLRGPTCNNDIKTVCWAHSPYKNHGKAGARKAHDIFGCYACQRCHDWLDSRVWQGDVMDKYQTFIAGMCRSWLTLVRKGVLS